jgi:O-antigen ligase
MLMAKSSRFTKGLHPDGTLPVRLKHWQPWILSILVAMVPLSFAIDQRIKALPIALLFLAGLGMIINHRQTRSSYRAAWPAVAAALLAMSFVLFNMLVHRLGWRPLDRPAHIAMYLVIAAIFSQPLRMRLVWAGFSLTSIVLGAACIVQHHVLGIDRAYGLNGGASASIELATILLGLSVVSLMQLLGSCSLREKALHITALVFGMYGALLTQSRGPLLAFAPIFVLLVLLRARRTDHWRLSLLLVIAFCTIAGAATFSIRDEMMVRFEAIGPEMTSFDHRDEAGGAVRERLEMWRTAGRAFAAHPFVGIGIGQFDDYAHGEIAAGRSNPIIGRYNQPHNEYLEAAATGGVPGLLVLLLVFLLPLRYFVCHVRDADEAVALPACIGMAMIGLYMLCAITDSVFYRVMPQSLYFFTVLGLALLIGRLTQSRTSATPCQRTTEQTGNVLGGNGPRSTDHVRHV